MSLRRRDYTFMSKVRLSAMGQDLRANCIAQLEASLEIVSGGLDRRANVNADFSAPREPRSASQNRTGSAYRDWSDGEAELGCNNESADMKL